jgi:hypothetical protein
MLEKRIKTVPKLIKSFCIDKNAVVSGVSHFALYSPKKKGMTLPMSADRLEACPND